MTTRKTCARSFYPEASAATIDEYVRGFAPPPLPGACAAVVPHAGWCFSGRTAARVFLALAPAAPATFVFLGAVHRRPLDAPAVDTAEAWDTPLGPISVDAVLLDELRRAGIGIEEDPGAHEGEHSIEVSLPFVRHFFPEARIVPIACPPFPGAPAFGAALGAALAGLRAVVVASSDLTHYGASYGFAPAAGDPAQVLRFVRENDERMLALVRGLRDDAILAEARAHQNACGSGAIAAAVAAARAMGARAGLVIEYRTSHDSLPEHPAGRIVGYGGAVMA